MAFVFEIRTETGLDRVKSSDEKASCYAYKFDRARKDMITIYITLSFY